MVEKTLCLPHKYGSPVATLIATAVLCSALNAQDTAATTPTETGDAESVQTRFQAQVRPLLSEYCLGCHNAEDMESGVRVDDLDGSLEDRQLFRWKGIRKQLSSETMPPEDEPQPTAGQRELLVKWIDYAMEIARRRPREMNGSVRRLTVSQYRNTLRQLLSLEDDLTEVLPPDSVSKEGFLNNGQTMQLSPLLVEAYFDIAEKALDRCIVDPESKPTIQNFRMDLGACINPTPCPDELILGANSHLLRNEDFIVKQLTPTKPFDYEPFFMRTKYRFIEGYQGNDTVRGWRSYDSIYHAVFACMRGTEGYPRGKPYQVIPPGLLLRPAIPSSELFGESSTYGPQANFKISLRELPDHERFRVTVTAARYEDGLLLDSQTPVRSADDDSLIVHVADSAEANVTIKQQGVYQVDVSFEASEKPETLSLTLADRHFSGELFQSDKGPSEQESAFMLVRLPAGPLRLTARHGDNKHLRKIVLGRWDDDSEAAERFRVFERRSPILGVHVGLRRDCGSTLTSVGEPQTVSSEQIHDFVFEGAIGDFPSPDVEKDNVNYLAGIREIGVRSEYTDGRDMPRLLIRSVEFEGPLYEAWPPTTHRNIFIASQRKDEPAAYASELIRSFATRAFRRPITDQEQASLVAVWENAYAHSGDFRQSVKDALLVVLTSPQFLFLIEDSQGPQAELLDGYELAAKLSYFLWNSSPDSRLLKLARTNTLHTSLDAEAKRMIYDPRFERFTHEFGSQWLSLDKLDVVELDHKRYPRLSRDVKAHLRKEPVEFLQYLIRQNLPLRNLVQADFILANEVVANYYNIADRTENGFEFVAIRHEDRHLGGVLAQAGILAGLSDGRESNPIKRGAWLARKIIAEPPDDPPPNVPQLPEDDGAGLTLRQKLERHRDQKGCAKCHAGIDPWGLPLEEFDAAGLYKYDQAVDARSTLPDKTEIAGVDALKAYLANDRIDQVAFSFLKHLATYATGRSLSYSEIEFLNDAGLQLRPDGYRMQEMLRFVINSPLFIEK